MAKRILVKCYLCNNVVPINQAYKARVDEYKTVWTGFLIREKVRVRITRDVKICRDCRQRIRELK